jgi:hypothetical protein
MSRFVILASFFLALTWHMPSEAFTLCTSTNSGMAGWQTKTLTFKVNTSGCPANINDLIDTAMKLWNSVPTSNLTLKREGTTTEDPANLTNANYISTDPAVIVCDPAFSTHYGAGTENTIAGVGACRTQGGTITRGYLILNVQAGGSANISNLSGAKQQVVTAHEIGHVIGLGHSADQSSLMFFDVSSKTKLGLSQDDIDGLTYLYPRNELGSDLPFGCGAIASTKQKPPSGPSVLFWLLPFATVIALRIFARGKSTRGMGFASL